MALTAALVAAATGLLAPSPAGATPSTVAEAGELMRKAAQELTAVDEQLHEAELIVATQQQAAAAAAEQAVAAHASLAVFEPQLRAIAQSGYTGKTQSRMAAFLTSRSADVLVQRMTTLDVIATRTNAVVAQAAVAQNAAREAQAAADQAAATAEAGAAQLRAQKAEVEKRAATYRADFDRLSAAEQARVTTAVAGRSHRRPRCVRAPGRPRLGRRQGDRGGAGAGRRPLRGRCHRARRVRLLGAHLVRLRRRRDLAAALEPGAVPARTAGLPSRSSSPATSSSTTRRSATWPCTSGTGWSCTPAPTASPSP